MDADARRVASPAAVRRRLLAVVFDECYGRMIDAKTRRDTLDKRSPSWPRQHRTPMSSSGSCVWGRLALTAFALTVELGDWHRFRPDRLARFSGSPRASTQAGSGAGKAGSLRPATATPAGFWSRLPGINAARRGEVSHSNVDAPAIARGPSPSRPSARRLHGRWNALEPEASPA